MSMQGLGFQLYLISVTAGPCTGSEKGGDETEKVCIHFAMLLNIVVHTILKLNHNIDLKVCFA